MSRWGNVKMLGTLMLWMCGGLALAKGPTSRRAPTTRRASSPAQEYRGFLRRLLLRLRRLEQAQGKSEQVVRDLKRRIRVLEAALRHGMRVERWHLWRQGKLDVVVGLPRAYCVNLPSGSFRIGSPATEKGRDRNEGPQHTVHLTQRICMTDTEITQQQFKMLMGYNPAYFKACGAHCPVEQVSWHEAATFANKLSQRQGLPSCFVCSGQGKSSTCRAKHLASYTQCRGWRLPTEAEWEYAARAGTSTAIHTGALKFYTRLHAPALDPIAWYSGNCGVHYRGAYDTKSWHFKKQYPQMRFCGTHPVAGKRSNPWGLYDTMGNVWEWTFDRMRRYSARPVRDPAGPATGTWRVYRGGSWFYQAKYVRAASRAGMPPTHRSLNLGFRLVRTLAAKE